MGAVHGKKALVVISNGKSTRANGYLDRLENELKQSKAEYIIFDKVGSNPTKPVVEEGGRFAKENITLNKEKEPISFVSKQLKMVSQEQLMDHFYNKPAERYLEIRILTPMSFKSYGRYINYPDLRLIYQSLMNKYDSVLKEASMFDEDTLDMLVEGSEIVKYNLRSYLFPLQGVKIPSFFGTMTIKVTSTDTAAKFIRLLLEFGEYSGVGIKTGLGMGAIQIIRRDNE